MVVTVLQAVSKLLGVELIAVRAHDDFSTLYVFEDRLSVLE